MRKAHKARHAHTRKRLARARLLLASGYSRIDVRDMLVKEFKVHPSAAYDTLRLVDRRIETQWKRERTQRINVQLEKLNLAEQTALQTVKHYCHEGAIITEVPAPDLAQFNAAVREENKLLDLYEHGAGDQAWALLPYILAPVDPEKLPSLTPATSGNGKGNGSAPLPRFSQSNGSS